MSEAKDRAQQEFLERLPTIRPLSVCFIGWVSARLRLPGFVAILVVCALPYGIGALLSLMTPGGFGAFTAFWLKLNLFMITAGAFILLDFIHKRTLEASEAAVGPIEDPAEIPKLEAALRGLFGGSALKFFVVGFAVPAMFTALVFLRPPFEGVMYVFIALYMLGAVVLLTTALWSAFALIRLAGTYGKMTSLRFNLIEPINTVGVRQMADLSTTWGICFALEALFMIGGLWGAPWEADRVSVFYASAFWTAFVIVITAITFIYPKSLIRPLVLRGKRQGLAWFQTQFRDAEERIGEIGMMELMRRERALALLKEYNELQVRITKARVSPLDVPTMLKLGGSVLVPAAVFLGQRPEVLEQAVDWMKSLLP